jgi:iron complex outermembrane receptor protein
VFAVDNRAETHFATGAVQHTLLLGVDYLRNMDNYMSAFASAPSIDVYNPVYGAAIVTPDFTYHIDSTLKQTGAYVQDQAKLDRWAFTAGVRHDWVTNDTDDKIAGSSSSQDDTAFSGRAGINYRFDNGLTPYLAYSHSFKSAVGTEFSGKAFKPTTGDQVEGGLKLQTRSSLFTAAIYQLTQKNSLTVDPDHLFYSVQQGETRTRGVELEARHHFTPSLSAGATYTYTQAKVTEANDGTKGNQLALVPKNQATVDANYSIVDGVLAGFGIGGAARFIDKHYGDAANAWQTPSYTLVDANAHYDLPDGAQTWRFQLTANNLLDREYISVCNSGDLVLLRVSARGHRVGALQLVSGA